jgi:hypothetical protein
MHALPEKFDKNKHAGTVFDPVLNRRVPVTDAGQLPTMKLPADIIMELQMQKKMEEERLLRERKSLLEQLNQTGI